MGAWFSKVATKAAAATGSAWGFSLAALAIVVWAITGPIFGFSDTWQLVINTGTTIVTFLMVFLIQNTQNRDTKALHLKLDELLRATQGARQDRFADLEDMEPGDQEKVKQALLKECGTCASPEEHVRHVGQSRARGRAGAANPA